MYRYAFGCFNCTLTFPPDYPFNPPVMTFTDKLWHPNVYPNGAVCISILHKGEDPSGYEKSSERWSPVLSIGKILLSVVSMLAQPNDNSPANVDAVRRARLCSNYSSSSSSSCSSTSSSSSSCSASASCSASSSSSSASSSSAASS